MSDRNKCIETELTNLNDPESVRVLWRATGTFLSTINNFGTLSLGSGIGFGPGGAGYVFLANNAIGPNSIHTLGSILGPNWLINEPGYDQLSGSHRVFTKQDAIFVDFRSESGSFTFWIPNDLNTVTAMITISFKSNNIAFPMLTFDGLCLTHGFVLTQAGKNTINLSECNSLATSFDSRKAGTPQPLPTPAPASSLEAASVVATPSSYVVMQGDTINSICTKVEPPTVTTVACFNWIMARNNLTSPADIRIGQSIIVPR